MLKDLPKFKRWDYDKEYSNLAKEDRETIDRFEEKCLEGCGRDKALDMKRNILKFKLTIEKPFSKINLKDTKDFMKLMRSKKEEHKYKTKTATISDSAKNDIKVHVMKLLRIIHKDWSERFEAFESPLFKQIKNPKKVREINADVVLSKDEIKKLLDTENKTYWKAFLMCQYEGALRTKECRELTWDTLGKADGDYYSFDLLATKTDKKKPIVLSEAKRWVDKLKQEQINTKQKGKYIFHAKKDLDKPVDKATVSLWMRALSKRALGREIWCYLLRHTRGTEYKKLIKENKLSKDNALETMGHSEKMFDKIYSHMDKETIREMIKEQIYSFQDLPEEKKHALELEIDSLKHNQEQQGHMLGVVMEALNDIFKDGIEVKNGEVSALKDGKKRKDRLELLQKIQKQLNP